MLQYHEVPSLLHETKLYATFKTSKQTTFAAISVGTAIASSSRTVANGCGRESGVDRTRPNPQTPKIKWEPFANNPKSSEYQFHLYFPPFLGIDDALFEAMFPMLCPRWAQLGVKLPPKGPKLCHFGRDLGFHVHHLASSSSPSGSPWAQLQPNMTYWRQLGLQFGPRFIQEEGWHFRHSMAPKSVRDIGPTWGQLWPNFNPLHSNLDPTWL